MSALRYFDRNMNANEVRMRFYDLLYGENRVSEIEVPLVKEEHSIMCDITVEREMMLASEGWMSEQY